MKKNIKTFAVFLGIIAYRLMPFRPPNVEPITASIIPISKSYGLLYSVIFSLSSIFIYDFLTAGIGTYTYTTAFCYSLISIFAFIYFSNKKVDIKNSVKFSVVSIIFYDLMTGVIMGPFVTGQNVYLAIVGQIPFTALHLMGGVLFAIVLTPMLSRFLLGESMELVLAKKIVRN